MEKIEIYSILDNLIFELIDLLKKNKRQFCLKKSTIKGGISVVSGAFCSICSSSSISIMSVALVSHSGGWEKLQFLKWLSSSSRRSVQGHWEFTHWTCKSWISLFAIWSLLISWWSTSSRQKGHVWWSFNQWERHFLQKVCLEKEEIERKFLVRVLPTEKTSRLTKDFSTNWTEKMTTDIRRICEVSLNSSGHL